MRDHGYARILHAKQGSVTGNFQAGIKGGTFSKIQDRDI